MQKILFIFMILLLQNQLFAKMSIEELKKLHENHEIKDYKIWRDKVQLTLSKRVKKAPQNIVDYISLDNKIYGFSGTPKIIDIDEELKMDFEEILKSLPKSVKEQLNSSLLGIYIISGLGSTGFTEYVYDKEQYRGGFIVFDQDVLLNIVANDWATWRVNSGFRESDDYSLSLEIEKEKSNDRRGAIEFILLHEIAHIIALAKNVHPKTYKGDVSSFEYSKLSWKSFKKAKNEFENRDRFRIYSFNNAKLSLLNAKDLIKELKKSDFTSFYGASNFFEDFAESYAIYVHTVLLKKPYSLKLHYKESLVSSYENPFNDKRLKEKREFFKKLFYLEKE